MQLFISPTSPYARKCRVAVRERGLTGAVEEVAVDPYANPPELLAANPVAQIPALRTDDGQVFIDSSLICAWLDTQGDAPPLTPREGAAHWESRRLEALGDAILEMAVKRLLEERRAEGEQSPGWIRRWTRNLERALDVAEKQAPDPTGTLTMGALTLAITGPYIDFRLPDLAWRSSRPRLTAFCDAVGERPSFRETRPPQ